MDGKIKLIPYDKHTNDEYRDVVEERKALWKK